MTAPEKTTADQAASDRSAGKAHATPAAWFPEEGEEFDLDELIDICLDQEERKEDAALPDLKYVATASGHSSSAQPSQVSRAVSFEAQGACKLKAIRLSKVLQIKGCMLWSSQSDASRHSKEVNVIDAFLSHNWRASPFAKYVALCIYYRWKPSLLAMLAAALLGPMACPMWVAPVVQIYIALSVACGMTALLFTLLAWPSRQMVFLDKACIEQEDSHAKKDGIMSLGYFLRRSAKTVVLWDEGYFSRLWCVFELAASMKLGGIQGLQGGTQMSNIVMLPLVHFVMTSVGLLGNFSFTAVSRLMAMQSGRDIISPSRILKQRVSEDIQVVIMVVLVALLFDAALKRHARNFRNLVVGLRNFSIGDAGCSCCSSGHVDPVTKANIACDRVFIKRIVEAWFGSSEKFEVYAQDIANRQLPMTHCMPYHLMVFTTLPFVMDGIGGCIWLAKSGEAALAFSYLAQRTYIAAVNTPLTWWGAFYVHRRLPLASSYRLAGALAALLRASLVGLLGGLVFSALQWSLVLMGDWAYCLLMPVLGGLTYLAYRN